jgi:hypothetical protein
MSNTQLIGRAVYFHPELVIGSFFRHAVTFVVSEGVSRAK